MPPPRPSAVAARVAEANRLLRSTNTQAPETGTERRDKALTAIRLCRDGALA